MYMTAYIGLLPLHKSFDYYMLRNESGALMEKKCYLKVNNVIIILGDVWYMTRVYLKVHRLYSIQKIKYRINHIHLIWYQSQLPFQFMNDVLGNLKYSSKIKWYIHDN